MIRSLADAHAAWSDGRHWSSWFLKNNGITLSGNWIDNAFSSGFPLYNARVGSAGVFIPSIATGNRSIYIPPVPTGQTRYLAGIQVKSSNTGSTDQNVLFDLLGYYPGVDGDSADTQAMDNTLAITRYTSGIGVQIALVCNVAPNAVNGTAQITYVDQSDTTRVTPVFNVKATLALGTLCNGIDTAPTSNVGPLGVPLANGSTGVKRVIDITFLSQPSGQYAIYLFKPLVTFVTGYDNDNSSTMVLEKDFFLHNGFIAPIIYDGAWLGQFSLRGGGNSAGWTGMFDFIWG